MRSKSGVEMELMKDEIASLNSTIANLKRVSETRRGRDREERKKRHRETQRDTEI